MAVDPEDLRKYYASLSDEELLAMDRADLIDIAQRCYDDEFAQRGLNEPQPATQGDAPEEVADVDVAMPGDGEKPAWLEEAAEVYSYAIVPGVDPAPDAPHFRDVLRAAGIPCYWDLHEMEKEVRRSPQPTHGWRLMVPGNLNLRATGVLERDIFNDDFEAEWKALLETFSDTELRAMNPRVVYCGLFDRVERVTRAYNEELARRKLASKST